MGVKSTVNLTRREAEERFVDLKIKTENVRSRYLSEAVRLFNEDLENALARMNDEASGGEGFENYVISESRWQEKPVVEETKIPIQRCLECGSPIDAATSFHGATPRPNDNITMCIVCGNLMGFGDDLSLREINDEEAQFVAGNPEVLKLQSARAAVRNKS